MKVLVSACLLGRACRHDGGDKRSPDLLRALARDGHEAVPFCPEEAAGLGTPRPAAHFVGGDGVAVLRGRARVVTDAGADVTAAFLAGAQAAVERARAEGCGAAYLKERSPSCGCACVHADGGVRAGCGVTTALLRRAGIDTVPVDA
jgi:uncharacterized protein YbbK (DUF523 family)